MNLHRGILVIIKASAPHAGILKWKPERFDQVQLGAGICTQANDIAGVGRDFRLDQYNMKHGVLL
jgi:hypothetical protein